MKDTPSLFPSASPSKSAKSWLAAETAFADSLRDAWNQAFKSHGTRAYYTRRNRFVCVQLHRWLCSKENDAGMTPQDVLEAIRLYAEDPHIIKHCQGRFTDFGSWLRGCPENVDKQLARVGRPRGTRPADPKAANVKAYAEQLLGPPLNLGGLARVASQSGYQFAQYVRDGLDGLRNGVGARRSLAEPGQAKRLDDASIRRFSSCLWLIERFESLSIDDRKRFTDRAERGVAALTVAPGRPLEPPNLRYALALALFAKECGTGLPTGQPGSGLVE
jgi:hypothetical protein